MVHDEEHAVHTPFGRIRFRALHRDEQEEMRRVFQEWNHTSRAQPMESEMTARVTDLRTGKVYTPPDPEFYRLMHCFETGVDPDGERPSGRAGRVAMIALLVVVALLLIWATRRWANGGASWT